MSLELNRLTGQVEKMGLVMAERRDKLAEKGAQARELLQRQPDVTPELARKIDAARRIDEWRRGALPLGPCLDERRSAPACPPRATLIAADGSQIYPDRHAVAPYYLLNTGSIVFRKGRCEAPLVNSTPELHFEEDDLYDDADELRSAEEISAQRNRRELEALADLAEADLAGRPGQVIPAADTHLAVEQACVLERQQDLLKELRRDLLALRDLFDLHHRQGGIRFGGTRQHDHCPKAVFTAFGKSHSLKVYLSYRLY